MQPKLGVDGGHSDDGGRRRWRSGEAGGDRVGLLSRTKEWERERRRGRGEFEAWVEVGEEEVEASRGGALIHPRRCRRGGRAATRHYSGAHRGNRREGRAMRGAGPARLVRWAGLLGWAEAQGEARGSPTPSSFLFFFLFFFFQQLLPFLFSQ